MGRLTHAFSADGQVSDNGIDRRADHSADDDKNDGADKNQEQQSASGHEKL